MSAARMILFAALVMASSAAAAKPHHYDGSIDHKQDANWRATVDRISKLSAKQNHGREHVIHTCYAQDDDAFCADVIYYKTTGTGEVAFVRVIRRGEDNSVYARDICRFTRDKTLRQCTNFDTRYISYWAENKDGKWVLLDKDDDEAASGGL